MNEPPCLIQALRLRAAGVSTVPIPPTGAKYPGGNAWKVYQEQLPTEDELRASLSSGRNGLAIIGGAVSGNYEILDFDDAGTLERFRQLAQEAGRLPLVKRLVRQLTPDNGCHMGYRCEASVPGNHHLARRWSEELKRPVALIETRGEGGLWLIDPSPAACHPSNRTYRLVSGDWADPPVITAEERTALHDLARGLNEYVHVSEVVAGPKPERQATGTRPGDAYNARGDVPALLQRHGWVLAGPQGHGTRWRRPGKDNGHSATLDFVAPGVLYVFSSSTVFEAPRAYSPFAVYAWLQHGGDFPTAARALAGEGYGDPLPERRPAGRPGLARAALKVAFRLPAVETDDNHTKSTWKAQVAAFRRRREEALGPAAPPASHSDPGEGGQDDRAAALAVAHAAVIETHERWQDLEAAGEPTADAERAFHEANRTMRELVDVEPAEEDA